MKKEKTQALYIRVLCIALLKSATHDLELQLRKSGLRIGIPGLVILRLLRHGEFTLQELSAKMFCAPATLIPMVNNLESRGLVRRGKDVSDRRKNPLSLTRNGLAIASRIPLVTDDNRLVKGVKKTGAKKIGVLISLLEELLCTTTNDKGVCVEMEKRIRQEIDC